MKLEGLLQMVEPNRHQAFLRFIETGEADPDFLAYMDRDVNCQRAVDAAFTAQAQALENLSGALKAEQPGATGEPVEEKAAALVMTAALEDLIELSAQSRAEAVKQAAATVTSEKPERANKLVEIARSLTNP